MRLTHAWANTAQINSVLKTICIMLTICLCGSLFILADTATSPPLIIERGCTSQAINGGTAVPTEDEIKSFITDAISARFNSKEGNLHLLSQKELKRRNLEQTALNKQGMNQKVFLEKENIVIEESSAFVSADRLISVKEIRSALIYKLKIQFARTTRSRLNPYGLVIIDVIELVEEKKEGK